jgi:mono/diheme cytochrome c family protein
VSAQPRRSRARLWIAIAGVGVLVLGVLWGWLDQPDALAFAGRAHIPVEALAVPDPTGEPIELRSADAVTRGRYLTVAGDCAACHTLSGHPPFSGGKAFKLPIGTIYAPNLTPDVATGIGAWSDADFLRAMHEGIDARGRHLYPVFPYEAFTYLSDGDVFAIKTYLFSLPAVNSRAPENSLIFPFNKRWVLGVWSFLYNPNRRFLPANNRSPAWNRGAYLTEALEHCGDCHTPRNAMLAMNNREKFKGTIVNGWRAFNITPDAASGIGSWTDEQLADYLATGHALSHGTAAGPMAEAVDNSLQFLSRSDINAIVVYLRSVPTRVSDPGLAVRRDGASEFPDRRIDPVSDVLGEEIFAGACAGCHSWNGAGAMLPYAQLAGAAAVSDFEATNVVEVLLNGVHRTALPGEPAMPTFAHYFSDTEIAAVSNYVTWRFGRTPSRATSATVAKMRASDLD